MILRVLIIAVATLPATAWGQSWFNGAWASRRSLTTASADIDSTLSNFPLYSELTSAQVTLQSDGDDLVFTDSDGTTQLDHYTTRTSTPIKVGGGWSFFNAPTTLYDSSADLSLVTWVDGASGSVGVTEHDHGTNTTSSFTLKAALEQDDHAVPSICELKNQGDSNDGKFIAVYSAHNGTTIYMRKSTNVGDATAWATEATVIGSLSAATYPKIIEFANGDLRVYYRGGGTSRSHYYVQSTDGGGTWGSAVEMLDAPANAYIYLNLCQDPNDADVVHFAFTDIHPNQSAAADGDVFHLYYDHGVATYYKTDGTSIATSLPLTSADATLVYDASSVFNRVAWVWSVAVTSTGNPVIGYTNFVSTTDHRYRYARWNGSSWDDGEIVAAGGSISDAGALPEPYYSGGIEIDKNDPDVVWLSIEDSDKWEIWRYETSDGGSTWGSTAQVTHNRTKTMRPLSVPGASPIDIFYMTGLYEDFEPSVGTSPYLIGFETQVQCYPMVGTVTWKSATDIASLSSSADQTVYSYYNNSAATEQRDYANTYDANYLATFVAGTGGLDSLGYVDLSSLTDLTVTVVFDYDGGGVASDVILSSWDGSTAGILMRHDGSDNLQCFVRLASSNVGGTFADLQLATGRNVATFKYTTTGSAGMSAWLNGVKSATTYGSSASLNSSAATYPVRFGVESALASANYNRRLEGHVEACFISNTARADDWIEVEHAMYAGSWLTIGSEGSAPSAVVNPIATSIPGSSVDPIRGTIP